jgi:peptidoglycan/LPS O-acetylase OafA/YrhL
MTMVRNEAHEQAPGLRRIAELDGLRGGAAAAVVIAHYFGEVPSGFRALTVGWIGVGVFFVLSGYLIGSIVLRGCGEAGFLERFYLRRAARILPVYGVVVLATYLALTLLEGAAFVDAPLPLATYLTFTQNVAIPFLGLGSGWLLPTWTLAVEEQFYLLLPLIVALVPRRRLAEVLVLCCLLALAYRLLVRDINPMAALTPLPARADMLLAGVLAALAQQQLNLVPHVNALRVASLAASIVLLGIAIISLEATLLVMPTIVALGAACFILAIVNGAPEGIRFRSARLGSLGAISYALYLVHQPVNGLLHGLMLGGRPDIATPAQIAVTLLAVAVSIGLASLSLTILERPIRERVRRATAMDETERLTTTAAAASAQRP